MEERIISYLDALEAALAEHGGAIADGALMWARIDAAVGLVTPGAWLAVFIVFWAWPFRKFCLPALRAFHRAEEGFDKRRKAEPAFISILISGGAGIATLFSASYVIDLWRWAGVFYPELWLVHKAMNAVGAS